MAYEVDSVVIGAGVVGLAIARRLALQGRDVLVLEAEAAIGTGISSRNSEVVHAGIYYPAGSLKARLCRRGRDQLYAYCGERGVTVRRCGKLIVATDERDRPALERIHRAALDNDVEDLAWLTRTQTRALEPELDCLFALHSPSTGIIDSHGLMHAFAGDIEAAGGIVSTRARVVAGECAADCIRLWIAGSTPTELRARTVINSAGLDAQSVASSLVGLPPSFVPRRYLAKGNYYVLGGRCPFTRLIYPAPEAAGLGTHLTLDLSGRARFGPDVEWIDEIDYGVDPRRAEGFYAAVRRYWPGLAAGALEPGYAGIRPKLQTPDGGAVDFVIQCPRDHGIAGLVNLFGIESPGLTSSMAIADYVAAQV